jgi:hypothetical protein
MAQQAGGKKKESFKERQNGFDTEPNDSEGQEKQPKDRKQDQCQ